MTGIGSGAVLKLNMKEAAKVVKEENARVADTIGINHSARTTTVKPAGTTSLTLGTSSGIHAWHNDYYIRRVRVGKNEAIYQYLLLNHPELVEDEYFRPHDTAVIGIPQKAPADAIFRTESPIQLLERVKKVHNEWIKPGHRSGNNTHNVSATVSIREHEWKAVGEWMWENRDAYNGLSVLPYDGGSYIQAPFEDCTKEKYDELLKTLTEVDLSKVIELDDNTDLSGEAACAGGACEIK
jgi:ribonucleoside-diphosphate reductase alpha chain